MTTSPPLEANAGCDVKAARDSVATEIHEKLDRIYNSAYEALERARRDAQTGWVSKAPPGERPSERRGNRKRLAQANPALPVYVTGKS